MEQLFTGWFSVGENTSNPHQTVSGDVSEKLLVFSMEES